ncbi:MAG: Ig-like domain-containing protein [Terracidiphilus sp.]
MSGCGGVGSSTPTGTSKPGTFSVTTVSPASGATSIATNAAIQVTFSAAADASTVNTTDIQVTGPKAVAGTVTYSGDSNTATFTPSAALTASTKYTVKVSGVTSSAGTALAAFTSTFTTAASSGSGGTTAQYQAPLLSSTLSKVYGQISIDTSGNMTVQLTGATANTTYSVQFCTAVATSVCGAPGPSCFSVGNVSTDATGSGTLTEVFPKPGNWAGDFNLSVGKTNAYNTSFIPGLSGENYMSSLQPATTVNGTGLGTVGCPSGTPPPQAPLTSGAVTYAKGAVTYAVTGTSPSTGFSCNESETTYLDSSGTYPTDTFTTNGSGDASSSSTSFGPSGDLFQVAPTNSADGLGFIGGFSVPK